MEPRAIAETIAHGPKWRSCVCVCVLFVCLLCDERMCERRFRCGVWWHRSVEE